MNDDDGCGSGLSGFAWHELGRQAERSQQVQARAVSAFAARLRGEVPVDVGALVAENQALRQQNHALWQQNQALWQRNRELEVSVRDWAENCRRMEEWGDAINALLQQLRIERSS